MKTMIKARRRPQPLRRGLPLEIITLEGGLKKPLWRPAYVPQKAAVARPKLKRGVSHAHRC